VAVRNRPHASRLQTLRTQLGGGRWRCASRKASWSLWTAPICSLATQAVPRQLPATRARPVLMPLELAGAIGYPLSDGAVAAEWGSLTMKAEEPITIGSLLGLLLLVFLPAILLLLIVLIVIAVIAVYFGQGRGKEAQR